MTHWRCVPPDLAQFFHVNIYDPAVLDLPWPGLRSMIFALLDMPESRLRSVLTIRR